MKTTFAAHTARVHAIFSSIAHQYDRLNTVLSWGTDRLWRQQALHQCRLKPGDSALDLCCGTGMMIPPLCRGVGEQSTVVGLDFNAEMLAVAQRRLSAQAKLKFRLVEGNVLDLPFAPESFSCITIAFGLRNIPDIPEALAQMFRVLKPGGRLVCLELSNPELPVFKDIYGLYFNHLLPVVGYLGTRNHQAYTYLRDSVKRFLSKKDLLRAFRAAGFQHSFYQSLTGGIAALHVGLKP
ncbi:MAG: bifunctional demethylmenaquinone methyltransferase/2-methoxy-6-polyprenyl-1,4-benzoquinol methylase UbiE [Spirochaetales bacterium]|nr:bifunctional demethylmenaquinone methyltransferase/2-methoxy-6-polyprenyl-1,4-benzoquinol methylase UbiE [Spirochaetales bacterium]